MSAISSDYPVYNPPLEPYISIVHRDADILVLDKPSGLLSVPGRHPALSDSLASRVQKTFPQALMIHRLDKDTSGVVLMSLNRKAHASIAAQFETRTTKKAYIAKVWGQMKDDEGLIVDHEKGKPAQTRWQVLAYEENATRLRLFPLTGRTHQLRVHMKALDHVILGDEFYADGAALIAANRLLLHAEELAFKHPDGRDIKFTVPCPF
jgi:tRNA pseudouridine32 synthase/23S rRNA pseudouridine746 synthase